LENLGVQGRAGITLFEYLLFEILLARHQNLSFANKMIKTTLSGVGRNNLFENHLFKMLLGRPQNTKLCT